MAELVKMYSFLYNPQSKRMFQVVDRPFNQADTVVLLELLPYKDDEPRKFHRVPYLDFKQQTETGALKEFMPRL